MIFSTPYLPIHCTTSWRFDNNQQTTWTVIMCGSLSVFQEENFRSP